MLVFSCDVGSTLTQSASMQMMRELVACGTPHMNVADHERFIRALAEGTAVKPEDPGHVIAALSINAPKTLSGKFVSWDSEECKEFRREQSSGESKM